MSNNVQKIGLCSYIVDTFHLQNKRTDEKSEAEKPQMPREHQVPMDFTGPHGRVINDVKEIEALAANRPKVVCIA